MVHNEGGSDSEDLDRLVNANDVLAQSNGVGANIAAHDGMKIGPQFTAWIHNQQARPLNRKIKSNWLKCISFMRDRLTPEEKKLVEGKTPQHKKPKPPGAPYDTWLNTMNRLSADIVKRTMEEIARLEKEKDPSPPKRRKTTITSKSNVEPFLSSIAKRLSALGYDTWMV